MKNLIKLSQVLCVMIVAIILSIPLLTFMQNVDQTNIDMLVNDTKKKANISNLSVVIVEGNKLTYLGGDNSQLYQIGSMTKAYTALGIQLLIDQGKISLDDTISNYLDGFIAFYQGKPVEITVDQLLAQTSGYTNSEKMYPSATINMSLESWCESISGKELSTEPGRVYAYSNVNYNLLGLIIEKVSGQSYREYMEENVLIPLGLEHTYCGMPDEDELIIEGRRQGFLYSFPYKKTVSEGTIPAGYFYSNIEDMGKWMQIQMNLTVVPPDIEVAIKKIQQAAMVNYYGGWEKTSFGAFGHSGGTPNYSSRIVFDVDNHIGVCVLANMNAAGSVDWLCDSILKIRTDNEVDSFAIDIWRIMDITFTIVTIVCLILFVFLLWQKGFKKTTMTIIIIILALLTIAVLIVFPLIFQAGWWTILTIWAPFSMSSGVLLLFSCTILAILKRIQFQWKSSIVIRMYNTLLFCTVNILAYCCPVTVSF